MIIMNIVFTYRLRFFFAALGEKRVCYIKDDAFYYQGVPAYQKHFINESLCSHIVFSRALIRNNSIYFREHRTGERL